jgi:saccharopine dehydrogenase-like NADP-dependent oxidoreductase
MTPMATGERRRITVLGGAGAMGRIAVRDLVETAPADVEIVIADRDVQSARAVAKPFGKRVSLVAVDVRKVRGTARVLRGTTVVVNACHHAFNLDAMRAALAARCHYLDLGGLFHVTRRQLRLDAEFRRAGLTAVCGMGSAPGIVNVMARSAADTLDEVREIHIAVGTIDRTPRNGASPLATSYSLETILDEASAPAAVFTEGKFRFVEALSGAEPIVFPEPVGRQYPAYTLHSEVATLPLTYKRRGVREVSFRIAFPGDLAERLRFLRSLGLLSNEPLRAGAAAVAPRALLMALAARLPNPVASGAPDEYEVLRVRIRGTRGGGEIEDVLDCLVPGMPAWGVGADIDTGSPPSIVAQMMLRGDIDARGVLPPERAVPPAPFFKELERRGMKVVRH